MVWFFHEWIGLGVWLKCQYSVFHFLANSVSYWWIPFYFPHFNTVASKKSVLTDPNFFSPKNHNSIQEHMVDELFLSINIVLTVVKLFNMEILHFFLLNLLAAYRKAGSNNFPSFNMRKVILSPYWNVESNYFPHFCCGK